MCKAAGPWTLTALTGSATEHQGRHDHRRVFQFNHLVSRVRHGVLDLDVLGKKEVLTGCGYSVPECDAS